MSELPLRDNIERARAITDAALAETDDQVRDAYSWRYLGDPILHTPTRLVEQADMAHVVSVLEPALCRHMRSAWVDSVGVSANQIGSELRVCLAMLSTDPEKPNSAKREPQLLINPRITERSAEVVNRAQEGCLSIPNFRTSMRRHTWIVVAYTDALGHPRQRKLRGFDAQIVQHEIDHLNGKTILDDVPRQQRRAAERAVHAYLSRRS